MRSERRQRSGSSNGWLLSWPKSSSRSLVTHAHRCHCATNYFAVGHSSDCFSFIKDWVEMLIPPPRGAVTSPGGVLGCGRCRPSGDTRRSPLGIPASGHSNDARGLFAEDRLAWPVAVDHLMRPRSHWAFVRFREVSLRSPRLPVRYVEIVESTPSQWSGNCVGMDIYSARWCIAPRYRDLMEAQVVLELAGGVAEAERRRHQILAFAEANCAIDAD
jgi:hypothetical protein